MPVLVAVPCQTAVLHQRCRDPPKLSWHRRASPDASAMLLALRRLFAALFPFALVVGVQFYRSTMSSTSVLVTKAERVPPQAQARAKKAGPAPFNPKGDKTADYEEDEMYLAAKSKELSSQKRALGAGGWGGGGPAAGAAFKAAPAVEVAAATAPASAHQS